MTTITHGPLSCLCLARCHLHQSPTRAADTGLLEPTEHPNYCKPEAFQDHPKRQMRPFPQPGCSRVKRTHRWKAVGAAPSPTRLGRPSTIATEMPGLVPCDDPVAQHAEERPFGVELGRRSSGSIELSLCARDESEELVTGARVVLNRQCAQLHTRRGAQIIPRACQAVQRRGRSATPVRRLKQAWWLRVLGYALSSQKISSRTTS